MDNKQRLTYLKLLASDNKKRGYPIAVSRKRNGACYYVIDGTRYGKVWVSNKGALCRHDPDDNRCPSRYDTDLATYGEKTKTAIENERTAELCLWGMGMASILSFKQRGN